LSENNLTNAFTFIEKLVSEFSWKRTLRLGGLLLLVIGVLYAFEVYSDYVRISRLSKATTLLHELSELSANPELDNDPQLARAYNGIASDLANLTDTGEANSRVASALWNALAAFFPWGAFFGLLHFINKNDEADPDGTRSAILGAMVFAIPFTMIGAFIPYSSVWINYVLYPLGHFAIAVSGVLLWSKYSSSD